MRLTFTLQSLTIIASTNLWAFATHCSLCPDGHADDIPLPDSLAFTDGSSVTCQELANEAAFESEESARCLEYYRYHGVVNCGCPIKLPPLPTCSFCENEGEQVADPETHLNANGADMTCGIVEYILAMDVNNEYNEYVCGVVKTSLNKSCDCQPPVEVETTLQPTETPLPSTPTKLTFSSTLSPTKGTASSSTSTNSPSQQTFSPTEVIKTPTPVPNNITSTPTQSPTSSLTTNDSDILIYPTLSPASESLITSNDTLPVAPAPNQTTTLLPLETNVPTIVPTSKGTSSNNYTIVPIAGETSSSPTISMTGDNSLSLTTSLRPTVSPTKQPSVTPTTAEPTVSSNPTSSPKPSRIPSLLPSSTPTSKPSSNPITIPSRNPSSSPTFRPSQLPTFNPSQNPTIQPSTSPTVTLLPSENPSGLPSLRPTRFAEKEPNCTALLLGVTQDFPDSVETTRSGYQMDLSLSSNVTLASFISSFESAMARVVSAAAAGCSELEKDTFNGNETRTLMASEEKIHDVKFSKLAATGASCTFESSMSRISEEICIVTQGRFHIMYSTIDTNQTIVRRLETSMENKIIHLMNEKVADGSVRVDGLRGVRVERTTYRDLDGSINGAESGNSSSTTGHGNKIAIGVGVGCAFMGLITLGIIVRDRKKANESSEREELIILRHIRSDDSVSNSPSGLSAGRWGTSVKSGSDVDSSSEVSSKPSFSVQLDDASQGLEATKNGKPSTKGESSYLPSSVLQDLLTSEGQPKSFEPLDSVDL